MKTLPASAVACARVPAALVARLESLFAVPARQLRTVLPLEPLIRAVYLLITLDGSHLLHQQPHSAGDLLGWCAWDRSRTIVVGLLSGLLVKLVPIGANTILSLTTSSQPEGKMLTY
jgi:hypothetical protein